MDRRPNRSKEVAGALVRGRVVGARYKWLLTGPIPHVSDNEAVLSHTREQPITSNRALWVQQAHHTPSLVTKPSEHSV
eukprot:7717134-Pyramimonas_sp.AAC.1